MEITLLPSFLFHLRASAHQMVLLQPNQAKKLLRTITRLEQRYGLLLWMECFSIHMEFLQLQRVLLQQSIFMLPAQHLSAKAHLLRETLQQQPEQLGTAV